MRAATALEVSTAMVSGNDREGTAALRTYEASAQPWSIKKVEEQDGDS